MTQQKTPRERGLRMPAEWEPQEAVWLAWSDLPELWPGNFEGVERSYAELVALLSRTERVRLLVRSDDVRQRVLELVRQRDGRPENVETAMIPYDDCWMRDNGPIFLVDPSGRKSIVDWGFNGWGDKFGPYDQDDLVPRRIAEARGLEWFDPGMVLEGGSIENNGQGLLLTSEECLLNPNRNGSLSRTAIEEKVLAYFAAERMIWLKRGLIHDHTDGHIDNLARFVDVDHVVAVAADDPDHPDYESTRENLAILRAGRTIAGAPLRVTTLPLPPPILMEEESMSPSHANFILANRVVIVPTYGLGTDEQAIEILREVFPDRSVVGLASNDILRGGGSLHCISQQEPPARTGRPD